MPTKQTIAVIGATGNIGSAISKNLSVANYKLLLFDNERDQILSLVQEIITANPSADIEAIDCSVNASWEADIIITDVSYQSEKELAKKIREVANQKIVISITNSLHDTNKGLIANRNVRSAEELQNLLPNCKVVKVFNTSFGHGISSMSTDRNRTVNLIAGNDKEALQTVFGLFSIAGFNPLISGRLKASRILENMQ